MPRKSTANTPSNESPFDDDPTSFFVPTGSITNDEKITYDNDCMYPSPFGDNVYPAKSTQSTSRSYSSSSKSGGSSYLKSGKVVDLFLYMNNQYYCKGVPNIKIDETLYNNHELSCVQSQYNQLYNNLVFTGYTNIHDWFEPNGNDFRIYTYKTKSPYYFELYNNYALKVLNMKVGDSFNPKFIRFTDTVFSNISKVQFDRIGEKKMKLTFTPIKMQTMDSFSYSFIDEEFEQLYRDLAQIVYKIEPYCYARIKFNN